MAIIGSFILNSPEGEGPRSDYSLQPDRQASSNLKETWDEHSRKLTQEIHEVIPDSVDQFVAKLTNATIRVEQCNPGEESSIITRTVITAESENTAREKLAAIGEISVNQIQNQVVIEQTGSDLLEGTVGLDSGYVSVSGRSNVVIRQIMTGGTVSISGRSGSYKVNIDGQDVASSLEQDGVTGARVEKREIILRVQPDSTKDYNLTTENGNVEILQGFGKAQVKTENGKINIGQFDGEFDAKTENGAVLIEMVEGNVYLKSENGRVEIGKVTGSANINTENGPIAIQEVLSDLVVISENGKIDLGEIGGFGNIKTENGAIVILKVERDLSIASRNGRLDVRQVLGSARIKQAGGSTGIGLVGGDLTVTSETGAIKVERVSGSTSVESRNGSITLGNLAKGVMVKTQTGKIEIATVTGIMNAQSTNGGISIGRCMLEGNINEIRSGTGRIDVGIVNSTVKFTAQSTTGRVECPGFAELSRVGGRGNPTKVDVSHGDSRARDAAELKITSQNGSITAKQA